MGAGTVAERVSREPSAGLIGGERAGSDPTPTLTAYRRLIFGLESASHRDRAGKKKPRVGVGPPGGRKEEVEVPLLAIER